MSAANSPDHIRVGDDDRSQAVDRLAAHAAAGRLTVDELEQRIGLAHAAVYTRDLSALEADLPQVPAPRRRQLRVPPPLIVLAVLVSIGSRSPVPLLLVGAIAWRRSRYSPGRSTRASAS